jgi:hypothetical protein
VVDEKQLAKVVRADDFSLLSLIDYQPLTIEMTGQVVRPDKLKWSMVSGQLEASWLSRPSGRFRLVAAY